MEGEVSWVGARRFDLPAIDLDRVAGIDFEAVHRELWPAWISAVPAEESAAFDALSSAVALDPFLTRRLDRTRALSADAGSNARGLLNQVWAWNRYLDRLEVPWRLTAGVQVNGPQDAIFYVKSYRVISDTDTQVGEGAWRTRVVQRVDDLGAIEGYLGLTSDHEQGALVVTERVASFAFERIWPLLDARLDAERRPEEQVFAQGVREAVGRSLPGHQVSVLQDTAEGRFWLERAVAAVHRRSRCGSRFRIGALPFDGLRHSDLITVRRFAAATAASDCPDVTHNEAVTLMLFSRKLQEAEALRPALEALTAWVARAIAIHEARHAADDAETGPLVCDGCPEGAGEVTRLEMSAYLASFAHPDAGVVALVQACAVLATNAGGRGEAIRFLTHQLGDACDLGPPADFAARAGALEVALFGRSEPIVLHQAFPKRLPLERSLQ
jgi:hypothetical protein